MSTSGMPQPETPTAGPQPTPPPAPQGASAPDGGGDLSSFFSWQARQAQTQQQEIGQNIAVTAGNDPNQTGEAQRLAQRFNVSPQLVESNLLQFRRQADVEDALGKIAVGASPILRAQLQDPNFAAIAHDDLNNLTATEKIFNSVSSHVSDIENQYEAGRLSYERGVLGDKAKLGRATPDDWNRIRQIDARLQQIGPQKTFLGGISNMVGGVVPQGGYVAGGAVVGGLLGAGVGLLGGPFAEVTVPGGAMEGAQIGAGTMFGERADTTAGGNAYLDMLDKGVHPETAKWASAGVGLINAALQVGGAKLVAGMPGVAALSDAARESIGKAAGYEIADAMTQPTVSRAVKSTMGRLLASSGEGGLLMGGQELTNQLALNAAELHDTGKFDLETDEGRAAAGRAIGQAFVNGALTIGGIHAMTGMLGFGVDMTRARDAQSTAQFFTALHDNAAESKVRVRNPASYEGYIARQADGAPAETIYVDGKQMAGVLAQSGLPEDRVNEAIPGLMDQVNEAAATGGDVAIPTEQYAARLAGTDLGKAMLPHIRMDPDAMSAQESAEFLADAQSKFEEARKTATEQMAANAAFAQSAQNVENDIFSQLKATKAMPDSAARTNATFVRNFVATQAARMNVTPEEFYNRYKYTIQAAGDLPGKFAQSFVPAPDGEYHFGEITPDIARDAGMEPGKIRLRIGGLAHVESQRLAKLAARYGSVENFVHYVGHNFDTIYEKTDSREGKAYNIVVNRPPEGAKHGRLIVTIEPDAEGHYYDIRSAMRSRPDQFKGQKPLWERTGTSSSSTGEPAVPFSAPRGQSDTSSVAQPGAKNNGEGQLHQAMRGGFDPSRLTTMLGQKADMSTFLHETAHYFLSVYGDLARQTDGPPEVKADMDALLKWFGVRDLDTWHGMSLEEQRKFHEQFAYSFEKYLADGKAPSKELEPIFSRFAQWLKRVYGTIGDRINATYKEQHDEDLPILTGEVRTVMDRMLASDEQIRNREAVEKMVPMFTSAGDAGMEPHEWAAYQAMDGEASEKAANELSAASIRQMQWESRARGRLLKEMQKQHDAVRAGVREQVAAEVGNTDLRRAQRFLKTSKITGPDGEEIEAQFGHKLDTDAVKAMFAHVLGETPDLGKLRGMTKKGGVDPEIIAPAFGFDNGEQMVRQLVAAPSLDDEIDAKTDARMLEEHGDMNTPKQQEAAVQRALHNDLRARFVGVELRALEKGVRPVRDMMEAAKLTAQRMLAEKKVGDIRPREFAAAEARAAQAAMDASKKGDTARAIRAKREQMLQNALVREAQNVRDTAETQLNYLSKFANPTKAMAKAAGADFMDRINELVAGYQLSVRDTHGEDTRPLNAWVNDQYAKTGVMPAVSDAVMANLGRMHWKDMTPEQLGDLHDAVKSLYYIGKRTQTVLMEGEQARVDDVVRAAMAPLRELPHDKNPDVRADLLHGHGATKMSAKFLHLKSGVRSLDAALVKMEQLFQWFDVGKDAGLKEAPITGAWARLFRMTSQAEGAERAFRAESGKALRTLGAALRGSGVNLDDVLDVPEMPRMDKGASTQWYREELLSAVLNMGNWGNKSKMLQYYGWREYEVQSAINRVLSKPEMDFVQGVWDHIGSYGQQIMELQRRLTGVTPKMVEPQGLKTKWGTYHGGYYPLVYDAFYDRTMDEKQARSADQLFENDYATPATNKGHTVERTGYVGPISFSLRVIARHLDQVTHDLAWREPIVDLNKILMDPRLKNEVDQTWGRAYSKQFRPWLQAMANNRVFDSTLDSGWEKLLHKVRSNATMVGIGFRLSTILTHGSTALSNSMGELGPKWFMKGVEQFMGIDRVAATRDFVYERSPEMAHRMDEWDRNLHEAVDDINRHQDSLRSPTAAIRLFDQARKFAFRGVSISDMSSALPTWMGAYLKGMAKEAEGGLDLSEDDAIEYANRTVRNAHGGGGTKDLAAIQRDRGAMSLATMFYSYWNHVYQRERDLGMGWKKMLTGHGTVNDMPRLLARSWFYFVIPQIAHAFWSTQSSPNQGESDNTLANFSDRVAEELALGVVAGVPGVRDMANAAIASRREYHFTPLEQGGQAFVTTARNAISLAAGEPVTKHAGQTAVTAAGYAFGLPFSQPAATTKFLWDYTDGDADPQSLKDWYQGVLTGHIR